MKHQGRIILLVALVAASQTSCGSDPDLSILDGGSAPDGMAELRKRQLIRTQIEGDTAFLEMDISKFRDIYQSECDYLAIVEATGDDALFYSGGSLQAPVPYSCSFYVEGLRTEICERNLLLDLASSTDARSLHYWDSVTSQVKLYNVPPQTKAVRGLLREEASELEVNEGQFNAIVGDAYLQDCSVKVNPPAELLRAEELIVLMEESFRLQREASQQAASDYIALSHIVFGAPSDIVSNAKTMADIRLHAARILANNRDRSPSVLPNIQSTELSPAGSEAVDMIRKSAIDPRKITQIAGHPGYDPAYAQNTEIALGGFIDEVRNRVDAFTGYGDFQTRDAFLAAHGVDQPAMVEARRFLADELVLWGRTAQERLPPRADAFGTVWGGSGCDADLANDMCLYAATANSPQKEGYTGHFASLVLKGQPLDPVGYNDPLLVQLKRLANILKYAQTDPSPQVYTQRVIERVRRALATTSYDLDGLYVYAKNTAFDSTTNQYLSSLWVGYGPPGTSLLLVQSANAVQCATTGFIDGVPCDWSTATDGNVIQGTVSAMPLADEQGMANAMGIATTRFQRIPEGPVYVLELKEESGDVPGKLAPGPGAFRLVMARWAGPRTASDPLNYITMPISTRWTRLAGEALMRDPDRPSQPLLRCEAGDLTTDGRVALENEISFNGDPYESSWRHLLDLAKQAANEADAIGQEAWSAGEQIDRLSEDALRGLEDLCGANVSLDPLHSLMQANLGADPYSLLVNAADGNDPELAKLANCIGATGVRPFTSLGTKELCAWHPAGQPNKLCWLEGTATWPADYDSCPQSKPDTGCAAVPDGYTAVDLGPDDLLNYFAEFPMPTTDAEEGECDALNRMQHYVAHPGVLYTEADYETDLKTVAASSWVNKESFRTLAAGIRWEARPGTHGTLYVGNAPVLSTGGLGMGAPAPSGVCVAASARPECQGGAGLLCDSLGAACGASSASLSRSAVQGKLFHAAAFSRWLGQQSLVGFRVPTWNWTGIFDAWKPDLTEATSWSEGGSLVWLFDKRHADDAPSPAATFSCVSSGTGTTWMWPEGTIAEWGTDAYDNEYPIVGGGVQSPTADCSDKHYHAFWTLEDACYGPKSCDAASGNNPIIDANAFIERLRDVDSLDANPLWVARNGGSVDVGHSLPWYYTSLQRFHDASLRGDHVSSTTLLQGLELLCRASQPTSGGSFGCGPIEGTLVGREQMEAAASRLACMANGVNDAASRALLVNLPDDAFDALRKEGPTGAFATSAGEYGQEVSRIRQRLVESSTIPSRMAGVLSSASKDLQEANLLLDNLEAEEGIQAIGYREAVVGMITGCSAAGGGVSANPFSWIAATANCASAIAGGVFTMQKLNLQGQITDNNRRLTLLQFEASLQAHAQTLQAESATLLLNLEEIESALARLDQHRQKAKVMLSQALFLDGDDAGHVFRSNTSLRRRYATANVRYQRAKRAAIRLAFLTKLAIEQRFGVHLSEMTSDMTLVDAPASWEGQVCILSGIDYANVRDATMPTESFADEFLGDYVRNLELFVESYAYDYPFSNAEDTAVVSLRDDIDNVRRECSIPSTNLLSWSAAMSTQPAADSGGWMLLGAAANETSNAVSVQPWTDADLYPADGIVDNGLPQPFTLTFGPGVEWDATISQWVNSVGCINATCGWTDSTAWAQAVWLDVGWYRVSWYGISAIDPETPTVPPADGTVTDGADAVQVVGAEFWPNKDAPSIGTQFLGARNPSGPLWQRHWNLIYVPSPRTVVLKVMPQRWDDTSTEPGDTVTVAGLMVENVSAAGGAITNVELPGVFEATDGNAMVSRAVCEDTDGQIFRAQQWRRHCIQLCDNGFTGICDPIDATTYCYRETEFAISQQAIDRQELFVQSGFARGNFNYRIGDIAVNFVGTAARQCADSNLPSTCYNAGFIPYSIEHLGPYEVRNAEGKNFYARLFTGRIEHARGLAAERYLTNPLSSADRALIEPYYQGQLRGRPLTGAYRLRVWEEPGVNFEGIEDVQILLNYRHWTRLY